MDRRQFLTLTAGLLSVSANSLEAALSLDEVQSGMQRTRDGHVIDPGTDFLKREKAMVESFSYHFFGQGLPVFGKRVFPFPDSTVHQAMQSIYLPISRSSTRKNLTWKVYVVDDDILNAYTPGGGLTFVNSGLIKACKTEAELASVLAHEVGHIENKHAIRRLLSDEVLNQFGLSNKQEIIDLALKHTIKGGQISTPLMMKISLEIFYKNFKKMWEHQADAFILKAFVECGYDLRLASKFFKTLAKRNRPLPYGTCLYTSHPETLERVARVDAIANSMSSNGQLKGDSNEFRFLKERIG